MILTLVNILNFIRNIKENKINETKRIIDYVSNMEKKMSHMTSEVLELKIQ